MVDPRIADVAADNRVPDLSAQWPAVLGGIARHGLAWLRGDRPPGLALLSRPTVSPLRAWAPYVAALIGAGGLAIAAGPLDLVASPLLAAALATLGVALVGLGLFCLLLAAALAHVVPPPKRPDCQRSHLPQRPDEPHPLMPYYRESGLVEYVPGQVWVAQMPLTFMGGELGARMVIVRGDAAGRLLVYSPIALDPAMRAAVAELGEVRWLIAPNLIHHLFVGDWLAAFPGAEAWAAPGLAARRPDLRWRATLSETAAEVPWDRRLVDHVVIKGHVFHEEIAMLHRPSGTLLLCDAIENLGHAPETRSPIVRRLLDLAGMGERPTAPTDFKLSLRDPEAMRTSARELLAWDFERIVIAHGRLIERDAWRTCVDAFAYVLEPGDVDLGRDAAA
ncbi:MAG: DUF4336 domain-containing protein [Myxococcales bacterium]|nr:DUF4336 domain-containing protein [Myxococcales bacterium]